jgi:hypothetical protein
MELTALAETALKPLVSALSSVLFYDVAGFPFIVLWLMVAALFFTLYLHGVNLRLLRHSFALITHKPKEGNDAGEISQLQAFLSAISATVALAPSRACRSRLRSAAQGQSSGSSSWACSPWPPNSPK